jgi:anti-anti-sigma regulatory factor
MRAPGTTETARGYGQHDHLCWSFDDPGESRSRALEFLSDGLTQGHRVCYVADGDTAALWNDLRELDGIDDARRSGAVQVQPLGDRYATGAVMQPVAQAQAYASATEEALAAGFSGLRVAAEMTPLVRTPQQLDALARYEHLIDRYMATRPFSALCAYNQAELGEETVAQVGCLHPTVAAGAPPFRLFASTGAAVALAGELDLTCRDLFPMALQRADLQPTGGELRIEARQLAFIDHRSLLALARYARQRGATAVLQTGLRSAARIIEVLGLQNVRVEPPN